MITLRGVSKTVVSGTEPLEYCDIHQPSLLKKIFGLATVKPAEPAPIDLSPAVPKAGEPAREDVRGTDKEKDKETEAPAKKRGFWSRIFRGSSGK